MLPGAAGLPGCCRVLLPGDAGVYPAMLGSSMCWCLSPFCNMYCFQCPCPIRVCSEVCAGLDHNAARRLQITNVKAQRCYLSMRPHANPCTNSSNAPLLAPLDHPTHIAGTSTFHRRQHHHYTPLTFSIGHFSGAATAPSTSRTAPPTSTRAAAAQATSCSTRYPSSLRSSRPLAPLDVQVIPVQVVPVQVGSCTGAIELPTGNFF